MNITVSSEWGEELTDEKTLTQTLHCQLTTHHSRWCHSPVRVRNGANRGERGRTPIKVKLFYLK